MFAQLPRIAQLLVEELVTRRMLSLAVVVGYTSSMSFLALVFTASFAVQALEKRQGRMRAR